ncbi:type I secretion C-terminal target domain-containing protein [uncultured Azohydromonas sp.]|uniref:calcium-binding protein n=1 Tax=uncultured Azohydromonas sp. TaxID=487342 RepID=UPI002633F388|nr:type I secretion C-terminal target domain-containing protein [uncultured Azohydromonas sp.]
MPTYYGSNTPETLAGGAGGDTLYGYDGADTLYGGGAGDYIDDRSSGNVIYGDRYATAPQERADAGNDTILAGLGNKVFAGGGNDAVMADGSSTIDGGLGADTITSLGGTNVVYGGLGADLIRANGTIHTDDNDAATALEGGDRVVLSYADRVAHGIYDVRDFKPGAGGDVLSLHELFADLAPAGYDGLNPLIDQDRFKLDGTRTVQSAAGVLGGASWLRLRQSGSDLLVEVDATGGLDGSVYATVAVLRGVGLAQLTAQNFDPPFRLDGVVMHASVTGTAGNDRLFLLDGNDTVSAGAGNDVVHATFGNDSVDGGLGSDTLYGGFGNDTLVGGAADGSVDQLHGEAGNDLLRGVGRINADGGAGADTILSGTGDDTLSGGDGQDSLSGGAGNDYLMGGEQDDRLDGGSGRDYLSGDGGDDRLWAGVSKVVFGATRNDVSYTVIATDTAGDYLHGGANNDTLISGAGNDTLDGGEGQLVAFASGGDDQIVTSAYYNSSGHYVDAGAGNDSINVGGSSTIFGGDGDDRIVLHDDGNKVNAGAGNDLVDLEEWSSSHASGVITLGSGADLVELSLRAYEAGRVPARITDFSVADGDRLDLTSVLGRLQELGFDMRNPFTGRWLRLAPTSTGSTLVQADLSGPANGAQWVSIARLDGVLPGALDQASFVYDLDPQGDTAARTSSGSTGHDTLVGADGADSLSGSSGNDLLDGAFGGHDTLRGGEGNDTLFGFTGNDLLDAGGGDDVVLGGFGNDTILGGEGNDQGWYGQTYKGRYYSVSGLHGEWGRDSIDGGNGDDYLDGGSGNDTLLGGGGNDYINANNAPANGDTTDNDSARGGDGNDYLVGGSGNDTLRGDAGNDQLVYTGAWSGGSAALIDGGADDDNVHVSYAGASTVLGGTGNDTISLSYDSTGVKVDGGTGDDSIWAASWEHDAATLTGGAGNDTLVVGGDALVIDAGSGADLIDLAYSHNASGRITTGADADVVKLSVQTLENGHKSSVITDFTPGAGGDKLDLSPVLGRLAQLGFNYADPFAGGWLRLRTASNGTDTVLQVDLSGRANGAQWLTLATLQGVLPSALDLSANFIPPLGGGGVLITGTDAAESFSDTLPEGGPNTTLGNDTVHGGGGNDLLDGSSGGADRLYGDAGNDTLFGFSDDDLLDAGADHDVAFGGFGNDTLLGGDGDDQSGYYEVYKGRGYAGTGLHGEEGNDLVDGGAGNDYLDGGSGDDTLLGGTGDDYINANTAPANGDTTDNDSVRGGNGNDYLYGGNGNDTLRGDAGNDQLVYTGAWSGGSAALIDGGADDDNVHVSYAGASTVLGGTGNDTISFSYDSSGMTVDAGDGADSIWAASWEHDGATLIGGAGNDTFVVSGDALVIDAGSGADFIDLAYGDNAAGHITTGAGTDTVRLSLRALEYGYHGASVITDFTPGAGGDRLDLSPVLGRLAEQGYDYVNPFTGGWLQLAASDTGTDTLLRVKHAESGGTPQWRTLAVLLNTSPLAFTAANFVDDISPTGFALGQTITGTAKADSLAGADGHDSVSGGDGNDLLDGAFGGHDTLRGGEGNDTLFGFTGNDLLDAGGGDDVVLGGFGNDTILGGTGNDNAGYYQTYKGRGYGVSGLHGEAGNDSIDGGDGDDHLDGGTGNDTLLGGGGNDSINANAAPANGDATDNDSASGGDGNDYLAGGSGNDTLRGDAGNDYLSYTGDWNSGSAALIDGGADHDYISVSLAGASTVLGGAGNDTISFTYASNGMTVDAGEGADSIWAASWEHDAATLIGGAGNDTLVVGGDALVIDAGSGADFIDLAYGDNAAGLITTGSGADVVRLSVRSLEYGHAASVITDLTTGTGTSADKLDISPVLGRLWELGYDYGNPFTSQWLRLRVQGTDTLLQVDLSGPGNGAQWTTLAQLRNTVFPVSGNTRLVAANFVDLIAPTGNTKVVNDAGTITPDTLVGNDANDSLGGAGDNDLLDGGFGGRDTLRGGEGSDTLFGFSGNDLLDAGLGNDVVFGGFGNDTLLGGAGDDNVGYYQTYKGRSYGASGLHGEEGNDSIDGGDGDDHLVGGSGNDTLLGGAGNDVLDANSTPGRGDLTDHDSVSGGDGADNLYGGNGNDTLLGGVGNDHLNFSGAWDVSFAALVDGGDDNDTINLSHAGRSTVLGGAGDDVISLTYGSTGLMVDGGDGDDSIWAASWEHDTATLIGGLGNDTIVAAGDALAIDAGAGNDLIDLAYSHNASGRITTGAGADVITLSPQSVRYGHAAPLILDFTPGAGGDRFDLAPLLSSLGLSSSSDPFASGHLRLTASGTHTLIEADADGSANGASFLALATLQKVAPSALTAANFVQALTPKVSANASAPTAQNDKTVVLLEDASSTALGLSKPTDPDGGTPVIRVEALPYYGTVKLSNGVSVAVDQVLTATQLTGLRFTPWADANGDLGTFRYTVADNDGSVIARLVQFQATPVNDAPTLSLGEFTYVDSGQQSFTLDLDDYAHDLETDGQLSFAVSSAGGQPLPAWLSYDAATHVLSGSAPYATTTTWSVQVQVTDPQGLATTGSFTLKPAGYDSQYGTSGVDTLLGSSGNDNLHGYAGADRLEGRVGDDVLNGYEGADKLYGQEGNDWLDGGTGDDALSGSLGDDTLIGGDGMDTLSGGSGRDAFRFTEAPNAATNVDTLNGFLAADDRLEFSGAVFAALGPYGALASGAFVKGTAAKDAGDRLIYDQAGGLLYYDVDGTGAAAQTLVAKLTPGTALSAADLFVV